MEATEVTEMTSAYDEEVPTDVVSSTYTTAEQQPQNVNQQQQQQSAAAPPPPSYCQRLVSWFPLRHLSFIGGIALNTVLLLSVFLPPPIVNPFSYAVIFYLLVFGFATMAIEAPSLYVCYVHLIIQNIFASIHHMTQYVYSWLSIEDIFWCSLLIQNVGSRIFLFCSLDFVLLFWPNFTLFDRRLLDNHGNLEFCV